MTTGSALTGSEVAIVGMAGRFPGARSLDEYWRNLRDGVESVRFFTDDELRAAGERPELIGADGYVPAQPVLDDADRFDAGFFGVSARDAALMDPQHRLFLELAWEAVEHAGYVPDAVPGAVGVFAACGMNAYMMHHLVPNDEVMRTVGEWLVRHTGNDANFLATRVSYQMNLRGPSLSVQTACSSALVAVHLACQHLLGGECDVALAGASTVLLPQGRGYVFQPGEILAADGHCRPFDARATGTVFGSGAGCVVLRRLADALADGDQVLASSAARPSTTTAPTRSATWRRASTGRRGRSPRRSRWPASTPGRSRTSRRTARARPSATRSRSPPSRAPSAPTRPRAATARSAR
jgi:acyl transferase domain-containing protein